MIVQISEEVVSVIEEMTPLIAKAPINDSGLQSLLHKCIFLCSRLSFLDTVDLNEFAQNNYEFLDMIKTIILRISECHKSESLETQEKVRSLIVRIDMLLDKLTTPAFLQKQTPTDKFTEPGFKMFKSL